eukprot:COSAG02_NODE_7562_length_2960_cov_4.329256_2_plen_478_part_00
MEPEPQPLSKLEPEPQQTEHSQTPRPGNLRRVVPPSPHIEGRAVTHHFLRRLTDARITPELKQQCTESSQAWYAQQIERTQREMEAEKVADGSGGGASVPRERKLAAQRLKQRLDQLTRDLEKRERATRPLAWYEEQAAEAERRYLEVPNPLVREIFERYDADGDGKLSQAEYRSYLQGIRYGVYTDEQWPQEWREECESIGCDPAAGVTWEAFVGKLYVDYRSEDVEVDLLAVRAHAVVGAAGQPQADGTTATATGSETPADQQEHTAAAARQALQAARRDLESRKEATSGQPFITGRDFHRLVIKADTHDLLCRYVELEGCGDAVDPDGRASVGGAVAFVSWNWDSEWELLLGALEGHTQRAVAGGAAAPRYWLDLFAVNQHTALPPWKCESVLAECPGCAAVGEDMMSLEEMVAGRKDKGFERVINSAGCDETLVRTRALCCVLCCLVCAVIPCSALTWCLCSNALSSFSLFGW